MTSPSQRWSVPRYAAATVLAASILVGCTSGPSRDDQAPVTIIRDGQDSPFIGTLLPDMRPPDITLTDTSGSPYNLREDTTAPLTLIFLGYTNCPDECPTLAADITVALRDLTPEERAQVEVLFVTADPERDTPKVIRRWLDRFDPAYEGLTGTKRRIDDFAAKLGIALNGKTKATVGPPGSYDVGHSLQVFAFNTADKSAVLWNGSPSVRDLAADLALLTDATDE
jgi:protein SCO1/2